jgi:DNA-binding NarL/FixJ family response regulator
MPHSVDRSRFIHTRPMTLGQTGAAACLLDAMENKEMARALGVSRGTTDRYVAQLARRYGARNRVALALALQREVMA